MCNFSFSCLCMQRVRVQLVLREPKRKQAWLIILGGLLQRRGLLIGSRRLVLSWRQRRAGEDSRAVRWLEAEGVRERGWWRRRSMRATQVSIVKFPEEFFVLHRQALVHLWLLLERFLQRCLFGWQLSVANPHNKKKHIHSQVYRCLKDPFWKPNCWVAGWKKKNKKQNRTLTCSYNN